MSLDDQRHEAMNHRRLIQGSLSQIIWHMDQELGHIREQVRSVALSFLLMNQARSLSDCPCTAVL